MACDRPSNGPYRIGAMISDSALKGCTKCSEGQKDALKVLRNDSLSRILSDHQMPTDKMNVKSDRSICEMNIFSSTSCSETEAPEKLNGMTNQRSLIGKNKENSFCRFDWRSGASAFV